MKGTPRPPWKPEEDKALRDLILGGSRLINATLALSALVVIVVLISVASP